MPLRHALDQMRGLVSRARSFNPASAKIAFGISASDYMQVAGPLPFVTKISAAAPDVQVMVRAVYTPKADLERGDVDVAFLQSSEVEGTEFRYLDVLRERYVGIARKHSLSPGGMPMDRFVAARHAIVSPRAEGFRGPTDDALAAMGLTRKVAVAVSSFVMMIEAGREAISSRSPRNDWSLAMLIASIPSNLRFPWPGSGSLWSGTSAPTIILDALGCVLNRRVLRPKLRID